MTWRVETLNETVDRELDALPADMRARIARAGRLIATVGLERVGAPHVKHLTGPLWEIRLSGRDGIARALYVVAPGRRLVVVRVFVKKTRRTPRREIRPGAEPRKGGIAMSTLDELHDRWSRDTDYREAYDRLGPEF